MLRITCIMNLNERCIIKLKWTTLSRQFFRADSWRDEILFSTWMKTVVELAPLKKISGRVILIGDGVKRACDGRFMPCVKKMDGIACNSTGYASRHKVSVK